MANLTSFEVEKLRIILRLFYYWEGIYNDFSNVFLLYLFKHETMKCRKNHLSIKLWNQDLTISELIQEIFKTSESQNEEIVKGFFKSFNFKNGQ